MTKVGNPPMLISVTEMTIRVFSYTLHDQFL